MAGGWRDGLAGGDECECGYYLEWAGWDPNGDAEVRRMFAEHLQECDGALADPSIDAGLGSESQEPELVEGDGHRTLSPDDVFRLAQYAHRRLEAPMAALKAKEPTAYLALQLDLDAPMYSRPSHVNIYVHWDRDGDMPLYETLLTSEAEIDRAAEQLEQTAEACEPRVSPVSIEQA